MLTILKLLSFGSFATRQHDDGCFSFPHCSIIDLRLDVNVHFGKGVTACGLLRLLSFLYVATDRSTIKRHILDTFKVGVNNSSKSFAIVSIKVKALPSFHSCISSIPWVGAIVF